LEGGEKKTGSEGKGGKKDGKEESSPVRIWGTGSFGGNVEHPIVTNGALWREGGDAALPKLLRDFSFVLGLHVLLHVKRGIARLNDIPSPMAARQGHIDGAST